MKVYNKFLTISVLALSLSACKNTLFSDHTGCDDESGLTLVQQILKDDLNKTLERELKSLISGGSIKDLDPAKLKLSAESVTFSLADSRTEFIDPNSPKTLCSIDLTVTIPSDVIKKSDEARDKVDRMSTNAQADDLGVEFVNGKANLVLEYSLQPTDKKDKVLATLKNTQAVNTLVSDTLTYAFLKPQIEKNAIKLNEEIKKQQSQAQRMAAVAEAEEAIYAADAAASEYYEEY